MRRLISVAVLLALGGTVAAGDFVTTKTPEFNGQRATIDLPPALHMQNTGGSDGAGLCVPTSIEVAFARWQNDATLRGYRAWTERRPGGSYPEKTAADIKAFCRATGRPEPLYLQHTGGDEDLLFLALKTRRAVAMTYAGVDGFYRGPIAHMVNGAHFDKNDKYAAIIDNNRAGAWVWAPTDIHLKRWNGLDDSGRPLVVRDRFGRGFPVGGGWLVVSLTPPPPPVPVAAGPWDEGFQVGQCANGRCLPPGRPLSIAVPQPVPPMPSVPEVRRTTADGWVPVEYDGRREWKWFEGGRFVGQWDGAWHRALGPDSWEVAASPLPAGVAPPGVEPAPPATDPVVFGDDLPTGVDATRLAQDRPGTYLVGDQRIGRAAAHNLVAAADALVDDSGKAHLTVVIPVGGEDGRAQKTALTVAVLGDSRFASYAGRVHFQVYTADDVLARGRVTAAVTLQEPAAKKGRVVATGQTADVETVIRVVAALDAKPGPKPVEPDGPTKPEPKVDWTLTAVISLVIAAFLRWLNGLAAGKEGK